MEQQIGTARRLAFFGGSFDPPHEGHLAIARAARAALRLDLVLFAPVGAQPLKPSGSTAGFADRLAMTRLAIEGDEGFAVSSIDAPKPNSKPNYTVDALLQLRDELPSPGKLFCLMGADAFLGLRHWHRSAEIPFVAELIVAARPGQPLDDLARALPPGLHLEPAAGSVHRQSDSVLAESFALRDAAGDATRFHVLPDLHMEISASQIRQSIRRFSPSEPSPQVEPPELTQKLLPDSVLDYIVAHGLYR